MMPAGMPTNTPIVSQTVTARTLPNPH